MCVAVVAAMRRRSLPMNGARVSLRLPPAARVRVRVLQVRQPPSHQVLLLHPRAPQRAKRHAAPRLSVHHHLLRSPAAAAAAPVLLRHDELHLRAAPAADKLHLLLRLLLLRRLHLRELHLRRLHVDGAAL